MTLFYSRSFALIRGSIVLDTLGLPVAAIAARATVAAAAARTTTTSAASVPASPAPAAVRSPAAMRAIGAPSAHGFTVRVFAVEVRFVVFIGEVATALKGDSFFGSRLGRLAIASPNALSHHRTCAE